MAPGYRVVVYETDGEQETVVMDARGIAFVAALATGAAHGRLTGELGAGGRQEVKEHLCDLIAADTSVR
jgi:hypothetical protein